MPEPINHEALNWARLQEQPAVQPQPAAAPTYAPPPIVQQPARRDFARSGTVSSRDIRPALAAYHTWGLIILLGVLFGIFLFLWLGNGVSTVGTLWGWAGVPIWGGSIIHIVVSLFERHALKLKPLILRLLGEQVWRVLRLILYPLVWAVGVVDVASTAMAIAYLRWQAGAEWHGLLNAVVYTGLGLVIAGAELGMVYSFIGLHDQIKQLKKRRGGYE